MARTKKERKTQRKLDRNRRDLAREKRRRLRAAKADSTLAVDPAHAPNPIKDEASLSSDTSAPPVFGATPEKPQVVVPEDPEIHAWWERFWNCDAPERIAMLRQKFSEGIPEDQPDDEYLEAILESESGCSSADYVAFLEEVRSNHPNIYKAGVQWFMRSRASHYMDCGRMEKVDEVVIEDAAMMTSTGDALFGTISMVRLAGRTQAAEALAAAAYRCLKPRELIPWAQNGIIHWKIDTHLRACAAAGATPQAVARMEAELTESGVVNDDEIVQLRREIVTRLARNDPVNWQKNQLTGGTNKASRNRYLLSYDFAGWLVSERSIPAITADELRSLLLDSLRRDHLTMKDYLEGLPQEKVDRHLASHLGFLGLDTFQAPAPLIAMKHFVDFLHEIGLVTESSRMKSERVISSLRSQLEEIPPEELDSFRFLDPLWNKSTDGNTLNETV